MPILQVGTRIPPCPVGQSAPGVGDTELAEAALLSSLADETPEGRSIVVLAKDRYGIRERALQGATLVPFTAETRMSGVDMAGSSIRKGAVDAIVAHVGAGASQSVVRDLTAIADRIAKTGGTPLAVAKDGRLLGVIHLKDIVKGGIKERFIELRRMGIKTIMITGDNRLTAAAIAACGTKYRKGLTGFEDAAMQAMVEATLEFARGVAKAEPAATVDLAVLLGDLVSDVGGDAAPPVSDQAL